MGARAAVDMAQSIQEIEGAAPKPKSCVACDNVANVPIHAAGMPQQLYRKRKPGLLGDSRLAGPGKKRVKGNGKRSAAASRK